MDPDNFSDGVAEANATELDRLGSQQVLVALTDADLDAETVLRAAAESEHTASETFAEWADTETDSAASETFSTLAEKERDHYERVVGELGDFDPSGEADPMHDYLRGLDDTVARAAGLVGRALVGYRTQLQLVNFFVNEADERRANLFRELREETRDGADAGVELLAARCDSDDWERAEAVATETIQVAYDDYAETLDAMGLDPRPIC
ncbi:ferritin family protein [Halorussus halophilus]|uniref:ferritin family protein n=1 Tax=Halorussus halophilus TaxID=2650975 RepID=UPI001300F4E3|nr:ferritin family protein [Halorussus halophilus]